MNKTKKNLFYKKLNYKNEPEEFEKIDNLANLVFPPHELIAPTKLVQYRKDFEILGFYECDNNFNIESSEDLMAASQNSQKLTACSIESIESKIPKNAKFIGFTALVPFLEIIYLAFFAISPKHQNKGYGSVILKTLAQIYPKHQIALEAESAYKNAPNLAQRLRRANFYERMGFINSGHKSEYCGEIYDIYFSQKDTNQSGFNSFCKMFLEFSKGDKFTYKIT